METGGEATRREGRLAPSWVERACVCGKMDTKERTWDPVPATKGVAGWTDGRVLHQSEVVFGVSSVGPDLEECTPPPAEGPGTSNWVSETGSHGSTDDCSSCRRGRPKTNPPAALVARRF